MTCWRIRDTRTNWTGAPLRQSGWSWLRYETFDYQPRPSWPSWRGPETENLNGIYVGKTKGGKYLSSVEFSLPSPANSGRNHHHLICRGLPSISVALRVWVVVDVLWVVINIVAVVVIVGIGHHQVHDVKYWQHQSYNAEGANVVVAWNIHTIRVKCAVLCCSSLPAFVPHSAPPPGNQRTGSGLSGRYSGALLAASLSCSRLRGGESVWVRNVNLPFSPSRLLVTLEGGSQVVQQVTAGLWEDQRGGGRHVAEDCWSLLHYTIYLRVPFFYWYTLHDNTAAILTQDNGDIPGVYFISE